jgi:hypothetical protein
MNQDKQSEFQRYSYDSFDQQPRSFGRRAAPPQNMVSNMLARFRSPLFAGAALLLTGGVFAAIIFSSYPSSDTAPENVPVITADTGPIRLAPDQAGGMEIPGQDNTVLSAMRGDAMIEKPPIENLLEQEPAVDKLAVFAREVEQQMSTNADLEKVASGTAAAADEETAPAPEQLASINAPPSAPASNELQSPPAAKVESMQNSGAAMPAQTPELHAAGSSPQTLDYVRSVLEKTEATPPSSPAAPSIEPAAGASSPAAAVAIAPGTYYIQLASIGNEADAPNAWKKLQGSHASLGALDYRLQRADIPNKGVFYRIQAGPMSKESASNLCAAIKAQKPGGCLIVQ